MVQASVADHRDIANLIQYFDTTTSSAVNEVRVFRLRNGIADELSQVLLQSLISSVLDPSLSASTGTVGTGGAGGDKTGSELEEHEGVAHVPTTVKPRPRTLRGV